MMAATRFGLFDLLAEQERTATDLAEKAGLHADPTGALLEALVAAGYLRTRDGRYGLTASARKWLVSASPHSLVDNILFRYVEWNWMARLDDLLTTGKAVDIHNLMSPEEWALYQRGMASLARLLAPEVGRRTPVPRNARSMLDIGGAHGVFSCALCQRHSSLRAVLLDLPQAFEPVAALRDASPAAARIETRAGDALTADLGSEMFDVVFVSQLAHHLDEEQNRDLFARAARALRPGGVLVVQEIFGGTPRGAGRQLAAIGHLYFALTSRSGAWAASRIAEWQRGAGLRPRRPIRFRTMPGIGQQSAVKR
jgi:SAM-dependent methyltransferase